MFLSNSSSLGRSAGGYVVLIYCLLFYYLPALGQYIFFDEIYSIYQRVPLYIEGLLFITISLVLFFVIYLIIRSSSVFIISHSWGKFSTNFVRLYARYRPILLISYCIFVGYIYSQNLSFNDVRYSGEGISKIGGLIYLYIFVKALVTFDLLLLFVFLQLKSFRVKLRSNFLNLTAVVLYFFMLGGTADVTLGLLILGLLVFGKYIRWFLNANKNNLLFSITRNLLFITATLPVIVLVLFLGESIKIGFSVTDINVVDFFKTYIDIQFFLLYLLESFSSHLHSINYALSRGEIYPLENHLMIALDSIYYRVVSIINILGAGIPIEKPDISSTSQFNFLMLTDLWNNNRQGTSPGVFASFIYLLGIPLGLIFSTLYLVLVARIIDWFLMLHIDNRKYSLIGFVVILILMSVFFQSPIDLINVIGNAFIFIITIIFTASFSKYIAIQKNTRKKYIINF